MKQVVIMPGGFHPFHAGHYALYQQALAAFPGADVYVAATADTSTRPFPFPIKQKLAKLAGVPANRFVQVKSPFSAQEITAKYDPNDTALIFVRSEKDRNAVPQPAKRDAQGNLPLVTRGPRKGQPVSDYLQFYTGEENLAPMTEHAYIDYLPTIEFGPGMTSATEIRNAWPTLNEKRKTALVMSLYSKTQKNPALAANVVKMLDTAMGSEELNEFAPNDGGDSRIPMHFVIEKELYNPRSKWKKSYKPEGGGVLLFTTKEEAIQAAEKFNKIDKNREFKYGGTQMADSDLDESLKGKLAAAALAGTMAAGSHGVVVNPNRVIDAQGHSAANPYGNTDSMGNPIKKSAPADSDKERLKKNTEIVDKEQRKNYHQIPANEQFDSGSGGPLPGKSKVAGSTPMPAPNPILKDIITSNMGEVRSFMQSGTLDPTGDLFYNAYEYFANEIPAPVRRDPHRLERRLTDMLAPYLKYYGSTPMNEDDASDVEQRMLSKIEKLKQYLEQLKKTNPEAYQREIAKRKTTNKMPAVSTFEQQGMNEAGFDREAFRRQMADLEAREELRKTDPVTAKALDLRGQLPKTIKKKPEDDSMSINDPRHPGAAYTQGNKLDEFSFGNDDDDGRVPDPYGQPNPQHYSRSADFFSQFDADWFDKEDMNDATGEFKGYWNNRNGTQTQIAYFKFDNPRRTGSNHPGMGWYYEPEDEDLNEFAPAGFDGLPEGPKPDKDGYYHYMLFYTWPGPAHNPQSVSTGSKAVRSKKLAPENPEQAAVFFKRALGGAQYASHELRNDYKGRMQDIFRPRPGDEEGALNEFAPDEGGGSRKFIPWTEFIEQVKQLVARDFNCKESVVKSTIKARFVPHDPMEFGPTMLYSYYETRGMGRNKGAISTRGSIQVGKYTTGGLFGQPKDQLLTSFNLLKGHPFERHFDLTFDNIYKIANIIQGNTEGALQFNPEIAEDYLDEKK